MRAEVYYFEIIFESIFAGKKAYSFPTREERETFYRREIEPAAWGSDPAIVNVKFNEGMFYVNEADSELWQAEGFTVYYSDHYC